MAVEEKGDRTICRPDVATHVVRVDLGGPDEQCANRVLPVEALHEPTDLVAVPDVAALELGQREVLVVDVVECGRDLHVAPQDWRLLDFAASGVSQRRVTGQAANP